LLKQRSSSAASEMLENEGESGEEGASVASAGLADSQRDEKAAYSLGRDEIFAVEIDSVESAIEEPIPLSEEWLWCRVRVFGARSCSGAWSTTKVGTGRTSDSLSALPKAILDLAATALSTRPSSWVRRRSPAPSKRSSRDCGEVDERMGMAGVASLDSSGSQKLLLLVLLVGWYVSPLRMDKFWNESSRVSAGSHCLAGRRRGWDEAGADMLADGQRRFGAKGQIDSRGDRQMMGWLEQGGHLSHAGGG